VNDIAKSKGLDESTAMLSGRDAGVGVLYARHWGELCRYIRKHFGPGPPDPEDVAQDAFARFMVIENRQAIDNPRAYLFRTAHNILVDEHRRFALRRPSVTHAGVPPESDDRTPERVLAGEERLAILAQSLRGMPAARRRSFLLNRLQGLSCAAIARKTGYSESAIKKHIDVALRELEASLSQAEQMGPSDST
jgi:RNA polymerase sigma factor (sigma-70 family)